MTEPNEKLLDAIRGVAAGLTAMSTLVRTDWTAAPERTASVLTDYAIELNRIVMQAELTAPLSPERRREVAERIDEQIGAWTFKTLDGRTRTDVIYDALTDALGGK